MDYQFLHFFLLICLFLFVSFVGISRVDPRVAEYERLEQQESAGSVYGDDWFDVFLLHSWLVLKVMSGGYSKPPGIVHFM